MERIARQSEARDLSWVPRHLPGAKLCRALCRNSAIPVRAGPPPSVSLGHAQMAAKMHETLMNTALLYHSVSSGIFPPNVAP